jgi:hypothetical protein
MGKQPVHDLFYDITNNNLVQLVMLWNGASWDNYIRYTYTYDSI